MGTPMSPGTAALMSPAAAPMMSKVKHDRRKSGDEISKYEKPLPFHLNDFMDVYLETKEKPEEPHDELIDEMALSIQNQVRQHYGLSSKTRLAFSNMDKAVVWEDFGTKTLRLSKRNVATLDPKFIPVLDEYVLNTHKERIEPMREKTRAILKAIYATDEEIASVEAKMAELGADATAYQYANLAVHRKLFEQYLTELQQKYAVVEFARKRELYMLNLVKWEERHKTQSAVAAKGKNDMQNWIAKFRVGVIKHFERSNRTLEELVGNYEQASGKSFSLNGKEYMPEFYKKQVAQISVVKTNFAHFRLDFLFFDNPRGGAEGEDIVERVLDPCIEADAEEAGALQLPDPPAMPIFADKVGFTFDYY